MKTFKLYSLALLEKVEDRLLPKSIPVTDGLIINVENQDQNWYIDAVIPINFQTYFEELREQKHHFLVEVVITSKDNHPAAMIASVSEITELSENVSVLLEAKLVLRKDDIIDDMVENLVKEGFEGDTLFVEFKKRKENLSVHSHKTLDEVYLSLKNSGKYQLL